MSKKLMSVIVVMGIFVGIGFYGVNKFIDGRVQVIQASTNTVKGLDTVTKEIGATHLNSNNKTKVDLGIN